MIEHGTVLLLMNQFDSAWIVLEECLDIYRQLYAKNPKACRAELASCLSLVAFCTVQLKDSGCWEANKDPEIWEVSFERGREAVELCRTLYAQKPNKYRFQLFKALNNHGFAIIKSRIEGCMDEVSPPLCMQATHHWRR